MSAQPNPLRVAFTQRDSDVLPSPLHENKKENEKQENSNKNQKASISLHINQI